MTQQEINRNRATVAQNLTRRVEARRLAEINRQLAEDEAAYRQEISRQMDCAYLFNAINTEHESIPVSIEKQTSVAIQSKDSGEWWEEYPQLYGVFCGAGIMIVMMIFAQFVVGAMGW